MFRYIFSVLIGFQISSVFAMGKASPSNPDAPTQDNAPIEVVVNLVGVQQTEDRFIIEYVDAKGNARVRQRLAPFGNYQTYWYVSSNGSEFLSQSWYCAESGTTWTSPNELAGQRIERCRYSVVSQLAIYSQSMSETCPLPITIEVNEMNAQIRKISPQPCHVQ